MNLKEQSYVCTLAETGNLTQAAKSLFISQPALSLYISNLENILGVRLFDRIGKHFVLTMAGELYVKNAKQMLALKETFDNELQEMKNGQNERLRVGIQDIRSGFIIPSVLPKLSEQFPHTKIQWNENNYAPLEQQLLDYSMDIAFCSCQSKNKDLEYIPLINDEVVFLTAKDHPLTSHAQMRPGFSFPWIDLTLFQNERFLLPTEAQSLRKFSNLIFKTHNIAPKNIFVLKKILILINLINQGYGVGFSQTGYIHLSQASDNLCIFSVTDPPVTATFYAIYKKGHVLSSTEQVLIGMVKQILDKQMNDLSTPYIHPSARLISPKPFS